MISRRDFAQYGALAGAASVFGVCREALGAEAAPETTRLRIAQIHNSCHPPQYMAEDLLHAKDTPACNTCVSRAVSKSIPRSQKASST